MVKAILTWAAIAAIVASATGCSTTGKAVTQSASGKNLNLSGYVMLGKIEMANPETATPTGEMIIGRVDYKSRKVAIPADQKVPTTGYFKATQTESLFGTKEIIIEYDFTAGSDADAAAALKKLEEKRKEAQKIIADGAKDEKTGTNTGTGENPEKQPETAK